jgi:hypothetical protein
MCKHVEEMAKELLMAQEWPPKVGDTVRVKRFRNEYSGATSQASGPIVSIEGSGDSAVYSVNCRTFRYVDMGGQVHNTALEPLQCSLADLEPVD